MAKFPEEVNFTPASADASATYPVQCGSLRKGGMVVLKVLYYKLMMCRACSVYLCLSSMCVGLHSTP